MTVDEAERQIGEILQALEKETGRLVTEVSLDEIDVTRLQSIDRAFKRHVTIRTAKHKAGEGWQ